MPERFADFCSTNLQLRTLDLSPLLNERDYPVSS